MRKILFRLLIIVLLFLLTVLGVAYYKNMKPLSVIQGRFGMKQEVVITIPSNASEHKVQADAAEKINAIVENEMTGTEIGESTSDTTTGPTKANMTTSSSSKLSEQDKRDLKKIVDGLVIK